MGLLDGHAHSYFSVCICPLGTVTPHTGGHEGLGRRCLWRCRGPKPSAQGGLCLGAAASAPEGPQCSTLCLFKLKEEAERSLGFLSSDRKLFFQPGSPVRTDGMKHLDMCVSPPWSRARLRETHLLTQPKSCLRRVSMKNQKLLTFSALIRGQKAN